MAAYRTLTFPLKKDVSRSSVLVFLLNGLAMFFICSGSPLLGYPIHIKAAEFSISALQPVSTALTFRSSDVGISRHVNLFYDQTANVCTNVFKYSQGFEKKEANFKNH